MNEHDLQEEMVPASAIARSANFRSGGASESGINEGERIGVPPVFVPELDDMEGFVMTVTAERDGEPLGPMTGYGQHLVSQGELRVDQIYGGTQQTRYAESEEYYGEDPDGGEYTPDYMAQTDREPEEGTPGRGVPLEDRYQHEEAAGVRRAFCAPSTAEIQAQLRYLLRQGEQAVTAAQTAENRGNYAAARHFDAKATKYANMADDLERKLILRRDRETRLR